MKKMSYDEIQVFYNELEGERLRIKRDLEVHSSKYGGMSAETRDWIKGYKDFNELYNKDNAVAWLFEDGEEEEETKIVLDALDATQEPKLVEISRKYADVKPTIPSRIREKEEMAKVILSKTSQGSEYALSSTTIKPDESTSGYVVTAIKELKQIKKRYKKISAREIKAMRKYKHISGIDMSSLYRSFRDLCQRLKPDRADWILRTSYYPSEARREFVLQYQEEVIDLFESHPQLEFARSQKQGKLK